MMDIFTCCTGPPLLPCPLQEMTNLRNGPQRISGYSRPVITLSSPSAILIATYTLFFTIKRFSK